MPYSSDCSSEPNNQKTEYLNALMQMESNKKSKAKVGSPANDQGGSQPIGRIDSLGIIEPSSPTYYPNMIAQTQEFKELFTKQFGDIIGKKLKKKLEKV